MHRRNAVITSPRTVTIVRWIARLSAAVLFLFWGGFFVEHLTEWFIAPLPRTPPPAVWLAQLLHFLILAGLVIGWRWELAGGLLVIAASVLFFIDKAPLFIPLTIVPGILFLFCWYASRGQPKNSLAGHSGG
jgi:hypothetical protein